MVEIADRLIELGHGTRFVAFTDRSARWDSLVTHETLRLPPEPPPSSIPHFDAVFMMNDWGVETQGFVRLARQREATSIARVEGVQDFDDLDTDRVTWPWLRNPYASADHILAQGRNDVEALRRRTSVHLVGNPRIEGLATQPVRSRLTGRIAVINSNFTYGVLTDQRRSFLRSAVEAIRIAGLRPVISQHPNDAALPPRFEKFAASEAMSDLLNDARVLISRFSTVPFEALSIGTPFVYFNPHGERVPTFTQPNGAFSTAVNVAELTAALHDLPEDPHVVRKHASAFLDRQIDIGPVPAIDRTVEAIVTITRTGSS